MSDISGSDTVVKTDVVNKSNLSVEIPAATGIDNDGVPDQVSRCLGIDILSTINMLLSETLA
jgi:hypothetical protein